MVVKTRPFHLPPKALEQVITLLMVHLLARRLGQTVKYKEQPVVAVDNICVMMGNGHVLEVVKKTPVVVVLY